MLKFIYFYFISMFTQDVRTYRSFVKEYCKKMSIRFGTLYLLWSSLCLTPPLQRVMRGRERQKFPFQKHAKRNPQHPTLSVVQVAHEFYMEISFSASQSWSESVQSKKLPFYCQNSISPAGKTGERLAKIKQLANLYFWGEGAGASQLVVMKTGESCGCWVNAYTCYSGVK